MPFTVTTVPLRPIAQVSGFLGLGTPVWDIRSVDDGHGFLVKNGRLGESLAESLADSAVVLMRGHGSTVVGKSLKLGGGTVGGVLKGAGLTPGKSYTLTGTVTFGRGGTRAKEHTAVTFRTCPKP